MRSDAADLSPLYRDGGGSLTQVARGCAFGRATSLLFPTAVERDGVPTARALGAGGEVCSGYTVPHKGKLCKRNI